MTSVWRILLPSAVLIAAATALTAEKSTPAKALNPSRKTVEKPKSQPNQCLLCHGNADVWEGEKLRLHVVESNLAGDIHWQKGLRCADCHGGNPATEEVNEAHAAEDGFRSLRPSPKDFAKPPDRAKVVELCGNCHANIEYMKRYQPSPRSDQLAEYWTSGHGKALKATGDPKVATCISCHEKPHGSAADPGKHGIRAVSDLESPVYHTRVAKTCAKCHADAKVMAGYQYNGHPLGHQQYDEWRASVHGRALMDKGDLSAPTCNNCHGNHGAVPPAVGSVANACGTCHGKIAGLFSDTRMKHRFEQEKLPGCATCHSAHGIQIPSDKLVGMKDGAFCMKCHENGKYGATLAGANAAREIRQGLDQLNARIAKAETTLAEAERLGMEVSQPRFDLRNAVNALTNARTLLHSFQVKPVETALADGEKVVVAVQDKADNALQEHDRRRVWLAWSLVPILIVIGLLVLYIRTLSSPSSDVPAD
jgi:predicted CXXCH cytochrome family protein